MLGITCDNASNNDTMIAALEVEIPSFRGEQSQCRCFAHIINLIVKSILGLFEHQKGGQDRIGVVAMMDDGDGAEDTGEVTDEEEYSDGDDRDDMEGWHNERTGLNLQEQKGLDTSTQPLKSMLDKVRKSLTCPLFSADLKFPRLPHC